ncbi:MAG TPA: 2-oxoacid:acceptor oxidoreductase family protein [Anaerolineales bacterium]|nr:2-oxoacid:acceptor oxidoreductase family protein [Anaerolineales bacterium]
MQNEIIIAGFGGQGVLFAGQILAYAAMESGKHVTWFPSYGPEMRGGTANCTVIISDEEIGAPLVRNPTAILAMNLPSLSKFEPLLKPGGTLVVNTTLVDRPVERDDIEVVAIPATGLAETLGGKRLANMVMLGALLAKLPVLLPEALKAALENHLPERHRHLLDVNMEALEEGQAQCLAIHMPVP